MVATRLALAALLAVTAVACAAAPSDRRIDRGRPSAATEVERREIDDDAANIRHSEAALGALRSEAAPDCPRACGLTANVCVLAERICAIAARYPPDDPVAAQCADGRSRCLRDREATAARCACPPPAGAR
jgi:hypothetical protein